MYNNTLKRQFITIIIGGLVAIIGFSIFFTTNPYALEENQTITNAYVLYDVLPDDVVDYTLTRIEYWANENKREGKPFFITSNKVNRLPDSYHFTMKQASDTYPTEVNIRVQNLGNFYSITVRINGEVQSIN